MATNDDWMTSAGTAALKHADAALRLAHITQACDDLLNDARFTRGRKFSREDYDWLDETRRHAYEMYQHMLDTWPREEAGHE